MRERSLEATLTDAAGLSSPLEALLADAASEPDFGIELPAVLEWARRAGHHAPLPGGGRTAQAWELLARTAAIDVGGARVLEPHLDACAILSQAAGQGIDVDLADIDADETSTWGVFAAEGERLEAHREGARWRLSGTKPWCSLASDLSHALVTAWTAPTQRRLFAVDLSHLGVHARSGPWVSRGLAQVVSAPVDFDDVPAVPVGDDQWYLERAGFAWGGMGVAAAWWGASLPVAEAVIDRAGRDSADQVAAVLAGEADATVHTGRVLLVDAATAVDAGVTGTDAKILAERVRSAVAAGSERILALADRALGPAPLVADERHARRIADLRVYLRQHHGARDAALLGRMVATR